VGSFPMKAEVIKTTVFPALGVESPVFERKEYSLKQFVKEVVSIDPDLFVAYVWKVRHAYTINGCITEIAETKVNGTSVSTHLHRSRKPKESFGSKKNSGNKQKNRKCKLPFGVETFYGSYSFAR